VNNFVHAGYFFFIKKDVLFIKRSEEMYKKSALTFAIIASLSGVAKAQIYTPPINMTPFMFNNAYPTINEKKRKENGETQQILNVPTNVQMTFNVSTSRTRTNLQNFANKTRKVDPEGAAKMEQMLASTDIMKAIGDGMRSIGLNKNNAADAFALYWINAWEASRGRITPTSPAIAKAVAAQAAIVMAQSPEFQNATDAQKQEMAEALMIQAVMIEGYIEAAEGDPNLLKNIAAAVRQGAKASGLDLDAMILTEQGFVKAGKKRADASDAAPGAKATAVASSGASASPAKTDTSEGSGLLSGAFPGIVIAGLAGSGIAAAFLYGKNKGANKRNG
jgi:hypothetical protein